MTLCSCAIRHVDLLLCDKLRQCISKSMRDRSRLLMLQSTECSLPVQQQLSPNEDLGRAKVQPALQGESLLPAQR